MNMLGLVCDPVGGLVEYPCQNRNAAGVSNALIAAEMSLAGITQFIPLDEMIDTMYTVGKSFLPSFVKLLLVAVRPHLLHVRDVIFAVDAVFHKRPIIITMNKNGEFLNFSFGNSPFSILIKFSL